MHIHRVHADRYLAFLGFALSFLFLLAIDLETEELICEIVNDSPARAREVATLKGVLFTRNFGPNIIVFRSQDR